MLVPKAIDILNKIPKTEDYIFTRDGQRVTARQIAYVLEKYAERRAVSTKSTHKIRKTYASNLNANGVIFNPLTEQQTYDLISGAL